MCDFFLAQDRRQSLGTFRIDQINLPVGSAQHPHEKEPERRNPADDRSYCELAIVEKMKLILPQLFLIEFVRTLAKVAGELFDRIEISSDRAGRVIATLEFLQHPLS